MGGYGSSTVFVRCLEHALKKHGKMCEAFTNYKIVSSVNWRSDEAGTDFFHTLFTTEEFAKIKLGYWLSALMYQRNTMLNRIKKMFEPDATLEEAKNVLRTNGTMVLFVERKEGENSSTFVPWYEDDDDDDKENGKLLWKANSDARVTLYQCDGEQYDQMQYHFGADCFKEEGELQCFTAIPIQQNFKQLGKRLSVKGGQQYSLDHFMWWCKSDLRLLESLEKIWRVRSGNQESGKKSIRNTRGVEQMQRMHPGNCKT